MAVAPPQLGAAAEVAAVAVTEVAKAVRMRGVEAPDVGKSFVVRDVGDDDRVGKVDEAGLPLVYDRDLIQSYWDKQGGALQQRWSEFVRLSVPFLTRVAALGVAGGAAELKKNGAGLARDARVIIEQLGPTYIKMGQMMSVRPDVLPAEALDELAVLQDSVKPFDTATAIAQIESELGAPLGAVFSEISEDPVAAASLAQVYKARLADTGEWVAVKVQRPAVLELVSKDLYVLRRAAEVYQGLVERFAPQQRTDYVALLNEWAVGFYTELDFTNEGKNQDKLRKLLEEEGKEGVYVPKVYSELCTRRLLVTEWVDGVKLSDCSPEEIKDLVAVGQESFLTQLLQVGFFHSDPHPGNLIKMSDQSKGKVALIDFGLVAEIGQDDMDAMVSSIVHLANKDYSSLVDDFIDLGILPADCDRAKVEPLMDKALSPYVKGGGARKYEEELKRIYGADGSFEGTSGAFAAMTSDMLTVLNDIPFTIPPYFALLGRAVVTLEGVALTGDPEYRLVMEAYPFVARKLLSEDRPEVQRALQEVLYGGGGKSQLKGERLAVILNSAMGVVAQTSDAFVDLDTVPDDAISVGEAVKYLLSPRADSLRAVLEDEAVVAADLLARQAGRRALSQLPPPPLPFLPQAADVPVPVLLPPGAGSGAPTPALLTPQQLVDALAPKLSREDELYALSLVDLAEAALGPEAAALLRGDAASDPAGMAAVALSAAQGGGAVPPELQGLVRELRTQLGLAETPGASPAAASESAGAEGAEPAAEDGVSELAAAASALTDVEVEALRGVAARVAERLAGLLEERARPLAGAA